MNLALPVGDNTRFALFQIRKRALSSSSQIIWTLIVLLIPLLGALAFLIVSPKE